MTAIIADFQISSASSQYVTVPVAATITNLNPTTDPVSMAFPKPGAEPVTFNGGSWLTAGGIYYAQVLVGPGGVTLAAGYYDVYVKVTDSPQVPVLFSGLLEVT